MTAALDRRRALLRRLADESFDVVVIGGGITGAGIARDAALRGLRTALVERDDFASGTSSRSSRLVHGGVRYLEHGYLQLVFEASRERRTLLAIAPHLVRPLRFTWPVYEGARIPRWKLGAGLALYDVLAMFRNVQRHHQLAAAQVLAREPALRADGLTGGAEYYDAATDDARLTLATAIAAAEAGAVVLNHADAVAVAHDNGATPTLLVRDLIAGGEVRVRARILVNAAGPWSDTVRRLVEPDTPPAVHGTKGVHIAVPRARAGNQGAITLLSPIDERVMFILPAGAHAIIGTTDTPTTAAPSTVRAAREDVRYLLASASGVLGGEALRDDDVVAAWAGIRPLIASGFSASPASASREHHIERGASGMISVTGGKLTTYRAMAAEVVDDAEHALGRAPTPSRTAHVALPGGDLPGVSETIDRAAESLGDATLARHLVLAHGSRWARVVALARREPRLRERVHPALPYIRAELVYAVAEESAWTLADLLVRRTHAAFELADHACAVAPEVARLVAPLLGWDAARTRAELDAYEADAARLFTIDEP